MSDPLQTAYDQLLAEKQALQRELAEANTSLQRVRSSALSLADANTRTSSARLEAAAKLNAESNPTGLDAERAANERLTNELDAVTAERDQLKSWKESIGKEMTPVQTKGEQE